MNAELLEALSSAFRTGYAVGHTAGFSAGFAAGWPAGVATTVLLHLAGHTLPSLYKKWKSEAKLRVARRDFKQFERQQKENP